MLKCYSRRVGSTACEVQPKQWECAGRKFCLGVTLWIEREHNVNDLLNMLAVNLFPDIRRGSKIFFVYVGVT